MGERVYVGRATPVEPIDEGAGSARRDPPLEYGRGNRASDTWRALHAGATMLLKAIARISRPVVAALGGGRRIFFATGLALLLAGLGDCISAYSSGDGVLWMFIGGLLIGLTVRVPLRGGGSDS